MRRKEEGGARLVACELNGIIVSACPVMVGRSVGKKLGQ